MDLPRSIRSLPAHNCSFILYNICGENQINRSQTGRLPNNINTSQCNSCREENTLFSYHEKFQLIILKLVQTVSLKYILKRFLTVRLRYVVTIHLLNQHLLTSILCVVRRTAPTYTEQEDRHTSRFVLRVALQLVTPVLKRSTKACDLDARPSSSIRRHSQVANENYVCFIWRNSHD
jgi:hypothetical protein